MPFFGCVISLNGHDSEGIRNSWNPSVYSGYRYGGPYHEAKCSWSDRQVEISPCFAAGRMRADFGRRHPADPRRDRPAAGIF